MMSKNARMYQLLHTSWNLLKTEGLGAFARRLVNWLKGERRFYGVHPNSQPTQAAAISGTPDKTRDDEVVIPDPYDKATFEIIGQQYLGYFRDLCGLGVNDSVLDVGCGPGRMALPLTKYLSNEGSYEGFDIIKHHIDWCSQEITTHYPNFRFQWANVYNTTYNPDGVYQPEQYRFPYEDSRFDLVVLASVFTHMLPPGMEQYLAEINRVLRPGGCCLITYFLLNDEANELIKLPKRSAFTFPIRHPERHYAVQFADRPEDVVGYEEPYIRSLYLKNGLDIVEPIRYGSWCGRKEFLSSQDIVIAKKQG